MHTVVIESHGSLFGEDFQDDVKYYSFPTAASAQKFADEFAAIPQGEDAANKLVAVLSDEIEGIPKNYESGEDDSPLIIHVLVVATDENAVELHIAEPLSRNEVMEYKKQGTYGSILDAYFSPSEIKPSHDDFVMSANAALFPIEVFLSFDPNVNASLATILDERSA